MGFWKFSAFLLLSILVLYQAGILQTAPFRSALESHPDRAILTEEETCLLLAALVKDYVQMKARELELEQETEGSSWERCGILHSGNSSCPTKETSEHWKSEDCLTAQKRSCNTAICVIHRLAGLLSRSGGVVKSNFVPTNVGSNAFGRRRRDVQA
ncbi:calcitonin gene-related peptide 2-like isoform X1 [Diceros bicornis minor]|uniref:calcitonin gene-related peptide 2-like isoform X1 n=1 Tax=Diceros bicornis minor TaxID=77932 RepID=UPI0026F21B68|nr:calcitonin gene-related peptide 2-like isoform X1 [Diceros bicornis minor]XP_058402024.1 calcitonin gene-related peptide 2-like isoform X1 [Diceros bicornis minor]